MNERDGRSKSQLKQEQYSKVLHSKQYSLSLSVSTYSVLPKPFIYNTFSQALDWLSAGEFVKGQCVLFTYINLFFMCKTKLELQYEPQFLLLFVNMIKQILFKEIGNVTMKFLNLSWQASINALLTCFFCIGENIYSLT